MGGPAYMVTSAYVIVIPAITDAPLGVQGATRLPAANAGHLLAADGNRRVGARKQFPRSSLLHTLAAALSFSFDPQVFDRKETGSPSSSERIPPTPFTHPLNVP